MADKITISTFQLFKMFPDQEAARTWRHKTGLCFGQPLLPAGPRFIRSSPWGKQKSLAGSGFGHFAVGL